MFLFNINIKKEGKILEPDYLPIFLSKLDKYVNETVCYLVDLPIKIIMASLLIFELNIRNIQVYT